MSLKTFLYSISKKVPMNGPQTCYHTPRHKPLICPLKANVHLYIKGRQIDFECCYVDKLDVMAFWILFRIQLYNTLLGSCEQSEPAAWRILICCLRATFVVVKPYQENQDLRMCQYIWLCQSPFHLGSTPSAKPVLVTLRSDIKSVMLYRMWWFLWR